MGSSNIANQNLKKQVLTQHFILSRMRLFPASERKIMVCSMRKKTYFGVGSSNIAIQNLKNEVLTQNFILSRMVLFSGSESQYKISKQMIFRFVAKYKK